MLAIAAPIPAPPPPTSPDIRPRQRGGTLSVPRVWVTAETPPTNNPWITRRIRKITGAMAPAVAYAGTAPIAAVDSPTPSSTTTITRRRPSRSANEPNRAAPPGRIRMLTANETNTSARLKVSLPWGKITFPTGPAT